jgi:hypothetical protein
MNTLWLAQSNRSDISPWGEITALVALNILVVIRLEDPPTVELVEQDQKNLFLLDYIWIAGQPASGQCLLRATLPLQHVLVPEIVHQTQLFKDTHQAGPVIPNSRYFIRLLTG